MDSKQLENSIKQMLNGLDGIIAFSNATLEQAKENLDKISPEHAQKLAEAMKTAQATTGEATKGIDELNKLFKNL